MYRRVLSESVSMRALDLGLSTDPDPGRRRSAREEIERLMDGVVEDDGLVSPILSTMVKANLEAILLLADRLDEMAKVPEPTSEVGVTISPNISGELLQLAMPHVLPAQLDKELIINSNFDTLITCVTNLSNRMAALEGLLRLNMPANPVLRITTPELADDFLSGADLERR